MERMQSAGDDVLSRRSDACCCSELSHLQPNLYMYAGTTLHLYATDQESPLSTGVSTGESPLSPAPSTESSIESLHVGWMAAYLT